MSELTLELFIEEIPALMQKKAEEAYKQIFTKHLVSSEIPFDKVEIFTSPRRVVIHIAGLPEFISAKEIEIKGPKINAPAQAIEGFCKSNEINIRELAQKEINGQLFYIYVKKTSQTDTKELLATLVPLAIKEYTWSKSMYWGDYDIAWVRPLKNILCLLNNEILPIKFGHLIANNITYGHRFMSPSVITLNSWNKYREKLRENYVILNRIERQQIIEKQLQEIAQAHDLVIKNDERLLEEVTGLVEWPVVMIGKISDQFLKLPHEALTASMRTHQKYFSAFNKSGDFAPYFLFVSNIESSDPTVIVKGNEKVLSARLSDALYFFEQDSHKTLNSMTEKLKNIVFHDRLGSIYDKTVRITKLCEYLAPGNQTLSRAAKFCKNDLVSEMVGEFPELQGVMGYYYALNDESIGEGVGIAIKDHYKPLGPSDKVPAGNAALLALVDKLDSLVGLMLVGEAPTGAGDPYALRRAALGVIRIILENTLSINLRDLIHQTICYFKAQKFKDNTAKEAYIPQMFEEDLLLILSFLEERTKFYFKNKYDISLINAALDLSKEDNLAVTELKLKALRDFINSKIGEDLLTTYKRTNNILDGKLIDGNINQDYLIEEEEKELFTSLKKISSEAESAAQKKDFTLSLKLLASLHVKIRDFFDNVLVNDQDIKLANNRLLLLQDVKQLFEKIAKFDQL